MDEVDKLEESMIDLDPNTEFKRIEAPEAFNRGSVASLFTLESGTLSQLERAGIYTGIIGTGIGIIGLLGGAVYNLVHANDVKHEIKEDIHDELKKK